MLLGYQYHLVSKKVKKISNNPKILVVGTAINKNIINIILSLKKVSCSLVLIGKLNDEIIEKLSLNNINYKNLVSINERKLIGEYINCDIVLSIKLRRIWNAYIRSPVCRKAINYK